jgi:hypothetical protein
LNFGVGLGDNKDCIVVSNNFARRAGGAVHGWMEKERRIALHFRYFVAFTGKAVCLHVFCTTLGLNK